MVPPWDCHVFSLSLRDGARFIHSEAIPFAFCLLACLLGAACSDVSLVFLCGGYLFHLKASQAPWDGDCMCMTSEIYLSISCCPPIMLSCQVAGAIGHNVMW